MKELLLRPYSGKLYLAKSRKEYAKKHLALFGSADELDGAQRGRMAGGVGADGVWVYLIWAKAAPQLAHELSHVILNVFLRCGMDPRECNGEPFCYMLSQLLLDAE